MPERGHWSRQPWTQNEIADLVAHLRAAERWDRNCLTVCSYANSPNEDLGEDFLYNSDNATEREGDGQDEQTDERWETSSTESKNVYVTNYYGGGGSNSYTPCVFAPDEIHRYISNMTIPHLKNLLIQWNLSKSGTKATLVTRIYQHLMSFMAFQVEPPIIQQHQGREVPAQPRQQVFQRASHTGSQSPNGPQSLIGLHHSSPQPTQQQLPANISSKKLVLLRGQMQEKQGKYLELIRGLNDEYAKYSKSGTRPFSAPPSTLYVGLREQLEQFNFDYSLPYPWLVEKKMSIPLVTDLLPRGADQVVNIEFEMPQHAGARILLVAIKFCIGDSSRIEDLSPTTSSVPTLGPVLRPFGQFPPTSYRHAYIRDFQCHFNGYPYAGGRHETNKVHLISSYLSTSHDPRSNPRIINWTLNTSTIPSRMASGYFLQVVSAKRDGPEWMQRFHRFATRSASEILRQLKRDFVSKHGISTSAIRISLRCPLTLQRIVTPVRSRHCKHPQCFELSSWTKATSSGLAPFHDDGSAFRCPVCDAYIHPDNLLVDGLVEEMLATCPSSTDEAIINPEEGTWTMGSPTSLLEKKKVESTSHSLPPSSSFVDLTLTPDEPVDPDATHVYIKPDPGDDKTRASANLPLHSPLMATAHQSIEIPSDPVMLDEADVIIHYHHTGNRGASRSGRGMSLFDAIILD